MEKSSTYYDMRHPECWYHLGDYQEIIELNEFDDVMINVFSFDIFPNVKHIVPSESYSGSRFDGCAVWADEFNTCKLLAYARLSSWLFDLNN